MLRTCILASSLHFYVCFLDANTAVIGAPVKICQDFWGMTIPYASTPTLRVKARLLHSFHYPHSKKGLLLNATAPFICQLFNLDNYSSFKSICFVRIYNINKQKATTKETTPNAIKAAMLEL